MWVEMGNAGASRTVLEKTGGTGDRRNVGDVPSFTGLFVLLSVNGHHVALVSGSFVWGWQ